MNYLQICTLLQHYMDMLENPKDLVHLEIIRKGIAHFESEWIKYNQ
jgi:hypothetical protein